METQLTVHHRSINNWNLRKVCERDGYEVHDLITDHGRFIYGIYEELNVERVFLKSFYAKEPCLMLKSYLESLSMHS